jgi:outer membrane lipoprotein-sorting protein
MSAAENIEKLIKKFFEIKKSSAAISSEMDKKILDGALAAFEKSETTKSADLQPSVWRIIMKSRITKLAAAAVIVVAVVLSVSIFNKSVPAASATTQVLQDAIKAVSDIWSVHMKAKMRTLPADNFSLIGLNYDFVPIEMWKRTDKNGLVQWRVEKPGRALLMDGKSTLMLIRPNNGVLKKEPWPLGCFDSWSGRLLNVQDLLDSELQSAKNNSDRQINLSHQEIEGKDKLVLEVEIITNTAKDDYLRNKFLSESDYMKVYRFDAATKLLEIFQVYVHDGQQDVLIFEVTDIEYNKEFDNNIFVLNLPENMIWFGEPQILPDNEKYVKMSPKEVAVAFFSACAKEDWNEFLKFWSATAVDERLKSYLGGLEIISIGEPFKSGGYGGWFVPYEIKLPPMASEFHLRLSNANSAKRFVITGMCDSKLQPIHEMKWLNEPEVLADNDAYAKMSPAEVVKAFNSAFSRQDCNEMRKFLPDSFVEGLRHDFEEWEKRGEVKEGQSFCEVTGEAFWSAEHSAYFVKCRQSGEVQVKKMNLAIRNDNPAKRWVVDGGL